jgi:small subunit ribosomal protein S6
LKTVAAKLYEAMFLVDSALAASDWQGVNDSVRSILEKVGAEIVSINKWDERKLAYNIGGKSRGTYLLAYFRVDGSRISEIERSVQLSEDIMRVLILSVEGVEQRYLAKEAQTETAQGETSEEPEEASKGEGPGEEAEPQGEEAGKDENVSDLDVLGEGDES